MIWVVHATKFRKKINIGEILKELSLDVNLEKYEFTWKDSKDKDLWLNANLSVLLDFEKYALWEIEEYNKSRDLGIIKRIRKKDFIESNGGTWTVPTIDYPYENGFRRL
jgi:hypothetical protein